MKKLVQVCALVCSVLMAMASPAMATPTLYGLTYTGTLVTINESNGLVTPVRGSLPTATYYSLAMINGSFYTYASTGQFYRFGLTTGDEVNLGSISYTVRSMSVRPLDGRVFAVVSTDGDIYGDMYAQVDLLTGNPTNYIMPSIPSVQGILARIFGLGFFANSEMLMTSTSSSNSGWSYVYRVLTPNGQVYDKLSGGLYPWYSGLQRYASIAIHPTTQTIYMTSAPGLLPRIFTFFDSYPPNADGSHEVTLSSLHDNNNVTYPIGGIAYNFDTSTVKNLRVLPGKNSGGALKMSVGVF